MFPRTWVTRAGVPAVSLVLSLGSVASAQPPPDDPFAGLAVLTPAALVEQSWGRHPSVRAAEAAAEAAGARPDVAGALPDPMLRLETAPLSVVSPDVPVGGSVQLSQRLPFPGKRGLREKSARLEAAATKEELEAVRRQLRDAALELFAGWYANARARELNEVHRELLTEMRRAAEAQYAAGNAPQQDALQAQRMLAELELEAVELRSAARVLSLRINALVHREPTLPVPPAPRTLELPAEPPAADVVTEAAVQRWPGLRALEARVEAAQAQVQLSDKAWLPDVEVMAGYSSMWMDPAHRVMVGVGLELPLQGGPRRAEQREAAAMLSRMKSERTHAVVEVASEVQMAREMLIEARQRAQLQRDRVLPAARAQLASARAGYVAGRNAFEAVIDAERSVRTAERMFHDLVALAVVRGAQLDRYLTPTMKAEVSR